MMVAKKLILVIGLILLGFCSYSQKVYVTQNISEADYVVYITSWESRADAVVYVTKWESEIQLKQGIWYFTKWKSQSDIIIYYTEHMWRANLMVNFTPYKSKVRWIKNTE